MHAVLRLVKGDGVLGQPKTVRGNGGSEPAPSGRTECGPEEQSLVGHCLNV